MQKGIVLFDIQDFLYQGLKGPAPAIQEINQRQFLALEALHTELGAERQRRLRASTTVPTVDIFLPTGDGYYLLCKPELADILDISRCVMALLDAKGIGAYCVAHVGEVNVFTDMTGRENATGFDLGLASRLQGISQTTGELVSTFRVKRGPVSRRSSEVISTAERRTSSPSTPDRHFASSVCPRPPRDRFASKIARPACLAGFPKRVHKRCRGQGPGRGDACMQRSGLGDAGDRFPRSSDNHDCYTSFALLIPWVCRKQCRCQFRRLLGD